MRAIMNSITRTLSAVSLFCLVASARAAEPYRVGSAVPPFAAKDQFGEAFKLGADCRVLMISFDMGTGKLANAKLSAQGKEFLPQRHAVYVANIHGMPAIGRAFALPKMRSYAHRIVLADDEALLAPFPRQEKRVTVLGLRAGKVASIRFWDPEKEEVAAVLGAR